MNPALNQPVRGTVQVVRELNPSAARVWLGSDGVIRVETAPGITIDAEEARQQVAACNELARGARSRVGLLVTASTAKITQKAQEVYAAPENAEFLSALAVVATSMVARITVNFIFAMSRDALPRRLVASEAEGLAWIAQARAGTSVRR